MEGGNRGGSAEGGGGGGSGGATMDVFDGCVLADMGEGNTQPLPTAIAGAVVPPLGGPLIAETAIKAAVGPSEGTESRPTSTISPPTDRRGPDGRLMEVLAIKL